VRVTARLFACLTFISVIAAFWLGLTALALIATSKPAVADPLVVRNFMQRRADHLLSLEPRLLNRFNGAGFDAGPVDFVAANQQPSYAASPTDHPRSFERTNQRPRLDVWLEGNIAVAKSGNADHSMQLLNFGGDYQLTYSWLIGVSAQIDAITDNVSGTPLNGDGVGWMVGPYAVYQIVPGAYLDARIAYGASDNDINANGTTKDKFETERFLASSHLSGVVLAGPLRMTPSVGVRYFEAEQQAYIDGLGTLVPAQTIALGRATFGAEFAASQELGSARLEEFFSLTGFWDFKRQGQATTEPNETLRARTEAGFTVITHRALQYTGSVHYDGLFTADHKSVGLRLGARLPF